MGDVSAHFNRSEFACQCGCGFDAVDIELIAALEWLREVTRSSITITSGNRCPTHNKNEGSTATKSKHIMGIACDFKTRGHSPQVIYDLLDQQYPGKYGLKAYKSWVHLDVRDGCWRG